MMGIIKTDSISVIIKYIFISDTLNFTYNQKMYK